MITAATNTSFWAPLWKFLSMSFKASPIGFIIVTIFFILWMYAGLSKKSWKKSRWFLD